MPTIWNGLPPILQGVAHLPRLALRVGMLRGDLPADDDVRLSLVTGLEEPPLAVLPEGRGNTALRRFWCAGDSWPAITGWSKIDHLLCP